MNDDQVARVSQNEALFRSVNEQIDRVTRNLQVSTGTMDVVCECADQTCLERISVGVAEYQNARRDSTTFIVTPGHLAPTIEEVLGEHDGYWLIKKCEGIPAAVARALDERR